MNKKSLYGYRKELYLFLEYSKDKAIFEIDTKHIKSYLRYREDNFEVKARSTLGQIRTIIKLFFDWLVEEIIIEKNPVNKINPYIVEPAVIEALNIQEIKEIQNACETPRERALIEVLLSTGCKPGEIVNISLKNINWDKNTITLGETNKNRVVLLTEDAKKYLLKYLETRTENTDFLFVAGKKPYGKLSSRSIQREITKISSKTKISKKISPITFRHTFAKTMLENGHPMYIVQSLLGHKSYSSTSETYIKVTNDNIRSILKLENIY